MNKYAKIAYDGYKSNSKGKSLISGQELPEFENLPANIQEAWAAASKAVRLEIANELKVVMSKI